MKFSALLLAGLIGFTSVANSQDIGWPQELRGDDGSVVLIYQPQVEVFTGNSFEARAAVLIKTAASGKVPVFEDVEESGYERVVNTPFLIVKDGQTHYIYTDLNRAAISNQGASRQYRSPGSYASNQRASYSGFSGSYSSATRPQLERDYSARQQAARRTQNYQRQGGRRPR